MSPVRFEDGYAPLNAKALDDFERSNGVKLPDDYRAFLLSSNGGRPRPDRFVYLRDGEADRSAVACFLGIHGGEHNRLDRDLKIYRGRLPGSLLPIATDPFGNVIALGLAGAEAGKVYFWDHELEADDGEEPTMENVFLIAGSLAEFLELLQKREDEGDDDQVEDGGNDGGAGPGGVLASVRSRLDAFKKKHMK